MARIAGIDLPRNKHINIALTYIYGIGNPRAARILDQAKVEPMKKVQDLGEDEVNRIRQVIEAEGSGRRRPAQGSFDEHQAAHRNRFLSWIPSSSEPAGPRTTYAHQRPHPKRSAQRHSSGEEEDSDKDVKAVVGR